MTNATRLLPLFFSFIFVFIYFPTGQANATIMSHYRVYERDHILKEFTNREDAIRYASNAMYRYVESIPSREWVYSNVPKFSVEIEGRNNPSLVYSDKVSAQRAALKFQRAAVRDLEHPGWISDTYPRWLVYSLDKAESPHSFTKKSDADAEIIRLKKKKRSGWLINLTKSTLQQTWLLPKSSKSGYEITSESTGTKITTNKSIIQAIKTALGIENAKIIDLSTKKIVYRNKLPYTIVDSVSGTRENLMSITKAIQLASANPNTSIEWNGQTIWQQIPTYKIMVRDEWDAPLIAQVWSLQQARTLAEENGDAVVVGDDGNIIWQAKRALQMWAWNGDVSAEELRTQVEQASGLDVSLPTWFILKDSKGGLTDKSDSNLVNWLHERGIEVHPLIHNQFDDEITHRFLSSKKAQLKWINALVARAKTLHLDGLNLDFEGVSGKDRVLFTAFAKRFAIYVKNAGLTVSIDLNRGDSKWDDKTAFDRKEIAPSFDYIAIMTYDEHYRGSKTAGSVASLQWVKEGVELFLNDGIRRDQLLLGVPFYTRMWKVNNDGMPIVDSKGKTSNRTVWMRDLPTWITGNPTSSQSDQQAGTLRYNLTVEDEKYSVWQEDATTMQQRFQIAKEYDLHGVAAWRLGFEPADLWEQLPRWK